MSNDHRKSSLVIGPRTRRDILKGKNIRKQADGCDVFEDYWTDSDHSRTDSTISHTKSDCLPNSHEVLDVDLSNKNNIENDNTTYVCSNTRLQTSKLKRPKADSKSPNKIKVIRTENQNVISKSADKSNLNNSSSTFRPRKSPSKKQNLTHENLQPEVLVPCSVVLESRSYTKSFDNKTVVLSSPITNEQSKLSTSISNVVANVSLESTGHISPRLQKSAVKKQELSHKTLQPEVNPSAKSFGNKTIILNSPIAGKQSEKTTSISNAVDVSVESVGHHISLRPRNSPAKKQKLAHKNLQPEVNRCTKSFSHKTVLINTVTVKRSEPTTSISNDDADISVESTGHLARVLEIDNVNALSKNKYVSTALEQEQMLRINEYILEKSNKRRNLKNSADIEKILSRYDEFDIEIMQRVLESENTRENDSFQHTHIETVPVKNKTINVDKSIRPHKVNSRSSNFKEKISSRVSLHKHNSQFSNEVTPLSKKKLCNSSDQVAEKLKYIHEKCIENTDENCENPAENNSDNYENYIDVSKKKSKKISSSEKKNGNDLKITYNQNRLTSHKKLVKKRKTSLFLQKFSETFSQSTRKSIIRHEGGNTATSGIEESLTNVSIRSLHCDNELDLHQSLNAKKKPVPACSSSIGADQMLKKNQRGKKNNSDIQIRRSSRQRYAPLANWRNQRLRYRFENGEVKILGIDEGTKEDDSALKQLHHSHMKRLEYKVKKLKENKRNKVKKLDVVGTKNLPLGVLKKFNSVPWENDYKGSFIIKKTHETINSAFGFLQIEINGIKPTQYMPDQDVHFTVMKGKLEINAEDHIFELEDRDMFIVPRKTSYSVKNIGNIKALIHFVVGKFHFIETQDV